MNHSLNILNNLSAGMADGSSTFDRLPSHESEALLLQAWQQLDRRHRFGIIPRVCRFWYHLSLRTFTSLDITLRVEGSFQQLGFWLRRHGSTLRYFSLDVQPIRYQLHLPWGALACAIESCISLSGLQLMSWEAATLPDLQQMKQLSSLELSNADSPTPGKMKFLESLPPQLSSLDLHQTWLGDFSRSDIHDIFSRMSGLTRLDARCTSLPLRYLASCPSLPPLQELKVDMPDLVSELAALATLPCSFLNVEIWADDFEECVTWCTSQQGKGCLGKLTGMSWDIIDHMGADRPWPHPVLSCLLTAATNLKDLTLMGPPVMDVNLLSRLTQLTSLCFSYAGPPDADVVSPLAALPNLQQLTVSGLSAVQANAVRAGCCCRIWEAAFFDDA